MLKAIIADDEIWICQFIKKFIAWETLGIEIVGEAVDGITAFDLICSKKPDIVITDIRMPGMDGIELVKRAKEAGMATNFIIISGFKQFEYAHSALKFGVEDYLLKPINKVELETTVIKIRNRILENSNRTSEEIKVRNQLKSSINSLKEQFLDDLLNSSKLMTPLRLDEINEKFNFNFNNGCFQVIAFKLDPKRRDPIDENYHQLYQTKLSKMVLNAMSDVCFEIQIVKSTIGRVYILNYASDNTDNYKKSIRQLFKDSKQYLTIDDCYHLTIGIGGVETEINTLSASFDASIKSIKSRIAAGYNQILDYNTQNYLKIDVHQIVTEEMERQLINSIEVLDAEALKHWINDIFNTTAAIEKIDPLIYYEIYETIVQVFSKTLNRVSHNVEKSDFHSEDLLANTDNFKSIKELSNNLSTHLSGYIESYKELMKTQSYAPIRLAKSYIGENYTHPISLNDIAKIVNLNPVYFSIIFKKETGMNFSSYIINYRLDIAKDLLKDIKYSISDVSEMVGYSNSKYFSKLFKKVIGITPMEYRKVHL